MAGTLVRERGGAGFFFDNEPRKKIDATRLRGLTGVTALIGTAQDDQLHFGSTNFSPEYPFHHTRPDIRIGGESPVKPSTPQVIGHHATAEGIPDSAVDVGSDYYIG